MQTTPPPRRRGAPKKSQYDKTIRANRYLNIDKRMKYIYAQQSGNPHPSDGAPEGVLAEWNYFCTVFWLECMKEAENEYLKKHYPQLL